MRIVYLIFVLKFLTSCETPDIERKYGDVYINHLENLGGYDFIVHKASKDNMVEAYSLKIKKKCIVHLHRLDIATYDPHLKGVPKVLFVVSSFEEMKESEDSSFINMLNFSRTGRVEPFYIEMITLQPHLIQGWQDVDSDTFIKLLRLP